MNWNFSVNILNAPVGQLVAAIYDPSAPSVPVQVVQLPPPSPPGTYAPGQTINGLFSNVDSIIYIFKLWDSPDTTPTGSLKNNFRLQPTNQTTIIRTALYLKAGSSIGFDVNTNFYAPDTPNDLTGWTYRVEDIGQGTLYPGEKIVFDTNGFHLAETGRTWAQDEEIVIVFDPQVANTPIVNQSAKTITGIVVLTAASNNMNNTYPGKFISMQGAGPEMVNNLPALGDLQEGDVLTLCSDGGSHVNSVLNCLGSDAIQYKVYSTETTARTQIILGQMEQISLIKLTVGGVSSFRVLPGASDGILRAGKIAMNYGKSEMNILPLIGQQGLLRSTYPRLWDAISKMDTQCRVTAATWAATSTAEGLTYFPNKGKFSIGDGSTTFGLPDFRGIGFFRGVNGTSTFPGDLQLDWFLDHQHDTVVGEIPGFGDGPLKAGAIYQGAKNTVTNLTSKAGAVIGGTWTLFNLRKGTETRPINHGAYYGIRI